MVNPVTFRAPEATAVPSLLPSWGRWAKRSLLFLGAVMALYVGAGLWAVRGDLLRASRQVPLHVLPTVIFFVACGWVLRALRWQYYVRRLNWGVPWGPSLVAFFASFAFTATPGKAGEVIKSVLLRTRYNVPLAEGAGVLVVERLGDLLAVLILAAGGLTLLADGLVYFVIAAVLVGGVTLLVCSRAVYQGLLSRIARVPRFARPAEKVLRLLDAGHSLLQPAPFLVGVGIALIAWSCEGWALHVLLRGFGLAIQPLTSSSVFGIATLVGALSALPGGLGSFEVVMVLLLSRMGLAVTAATLPVLLFRFCTFWLGSFVGLIFLAGWYVCLTTSNSKAPTGGLK
jgi:glycosyltransferase 2 family protein